MGLLLGILILLLIVPVYFIPTMIANARGHHNVSGIGMLNLIAGWTFIGWLVALVMACGTVNAPAPIYRCPDCNARLGDEDRYCPRCGASLFE